MLRSIKPFAPATQWLAAVPSTSGGRRQGRQMAVVPAAGGGFGKPAEKKLSKQKACPCGSGLAYKASLLRRRMHGGLPPPACH